MLEAAELSHWTAISVNAVAVTYNGQPGTIDMIPAGLLTQQQNDTGFVSNHVEQEWIALISDMQTASVWPPKRGDYLEYTDASGIDRRFELMPNAGEKVFEPFGNYGVMASLNTKEIVDA